MIKPQPFKVTCQHCSWHKVFSPRSDALTPNDIPPSICPQCKCTELKKQKLSLIDEISSLFKII